MQLENQLKQNKLTLQKLYFYADSALRTVDALDKVTFEAIATGSRGGNLLNLIYQRYLTMGGYDGKFLLTRYSDSQLQNMFHLLLQKTSVPFFDMLEQWLYKGIVNDVYNEFMIAENKSVSKDTLIVDFDSKYVYKIYNEFAAIGSNDSC